jgi:glycosyltransferase involved in cell wall biosynthesis
MGNMSPDFAERQKMSEAPEEIRVAWLFPSLARGYYWQPVFKEFAARCPQTAVFTSIWPGFAEGLEGSFKVHIIPGLGYVDLRKKLPDSRRGFIWTPPSILRKLAAFGPDVIFSSGFSGWTLCALLFKLFRRSRVIIYWEGCSAQSIGRSRTKAWLRRLIAHFVDAGVSNSNEGIRYLRDVLGMQQDNLLSHPCQVPDLSLIGSGPEDAHPSELKRPVFLYVGSLIPRKGWRYLLDATQLLLNQGISQFSVVFVGAGERANELRAAIKDQQLESIVHQVGAVTYDKLGAYFRGADVFVSPTRADTWGVAVLEAMAFGKPVLCSKYAGSRQMVTHGENGFIFDPFDTKELAGYMAKFIGDQDLAPRFGIRSLERMAPFTPSWAAEALASLAQQTLCRRQRYTSRSTADRETSSIAIHKVSL